MNVNVNISCKKTLQSVLKSDNILFCTCFSPYEGAVGLLWKGISIDRKGLSHNKLTG